MKFTPLKLSAGAPGAGKNSLIIENPYAEYFDLFSREFKLKPVTTYRFTAKLKAEKGGETVRISVFKVDDKWLAYSRMFNFAGGEWKNFDFTFTTEKREGNGWHHIQIASATHDGKIADTFYIDDLKIEEIGAPSAPINATVAPDKTLYLRGGTARRSRPDSVRNSALVTPQTVNVPTPCGRVRRPVFCARIPAVSALRRDLLQNPSTC